MARVRLGSHHLQALGHRWRKVGKHPKDIWKYVFSNSFHHSEIIRYMICEQLNPCSGYSMATNWKLSLCAVNNVSTFHGGAGALFSAVWVLEPTRRWQLNP